MMQEIRTKIKQKRPVCDAKSGKRKSFPLSLTQIASLLNEATECGTMYQSFKN